MMTRLLIFVLLALPAFCQNAARYPTTITTMQDLAFARDAPNKSQLTSSINNVTLTATVADGSLFRPFNLLTFSDTGEQVMVCTVLVNDLQLCGRGFAGTSATFHSSGVILSGNVTAWHHNQLASEVIAIQSALGPNLSNLPPAPTWLTLSGHPTAVSAFTNDAGYITSIGTLPISTFTNDSGYLTPSTLNDFTGGLNATSLGNPLTSRLIVHVTPTVSGGTIGGIYSMIDAAAPANNGTNIGISSSVTSTNTNNASTNAALSATASGSSGNNIGLLIDVALANGNYAVKSAGGANSLFGGKLIIGPNPNGGDKTPLRLSGVLYFTSNTSARTGGLVTGDIYQCSQSTVGTLCIVF